MYLEMVVRNQNVVKEFVEDFYKAFEKYFEGKDYLVKKGDRWSVSVGFCQPYFPHQTIKRHDLTHLTVRLDISLLIEMQMRKQGEFNNLRDRVGGCLVSRYLEQEGKKDKELLKRVSKQVISFVNDISLMCNGEEVIFIGSALKEFDVTEKTCPICGRKFVGSNKRKYCSDACRSKAYRMRKKEEQ